MRSRSILISLAVVASLAASLAACGGGGGGSTGGTIPNPGSTATPTPGSTATPTPASTATPTPIPSPTVTPGTSSSGIWVSEPYNIVSTSAQNGVVEKFAPSANGDSAPAQSFTTPFSSWANLRGVQTDNAGNVYVLDIGNTQQANLPYVEIFSPAANGSVSPTSTIGGSNTTMTASSAVVDMAVTPTGGVFVSQGTVGNWALDYFAPTNRGNVTPTCAMLNQRFYIRFMRYDGWTGNIVALGYDSTSNQYVLENLQPNTSTCALTAVGYSQPLGNFDAEDLAVDANNVYLIGYDGGTSKQGEITLAKSGLTGSGFPIVPTSSAEWAAGAVVGGAAVLAGYKIGVTPTGTVWLGAAEDQGGNPTTGVLISLPVGSSNPSAVVYGGAPSTSCPMAQQNAGITGLCQVVGGIANAP